MRLNLAILVLVMVSAFSLVHVQFDSRRLYTQLDKAQSQAKALEVEYEQLLLEKRAQATSGRVQQMSVAQLQMRPTNPAITYYVTDSVSRVNAPPQVNAAASPEPSR